MPDVKKKKKNQKHTGLRVMHSVRQVRVQVDTIKEDRGGGSDDRCHRNTKTVGRGTGSAHCPQEETHT